MYTNTLLDICQMIIHVTYSKIHTSYNDIVLEYLIYLLRVDNIHILFQKYTALAKELKITHTAVIFWRGKQLLFILCKGIL